MILTIHFFTLLQNILGAQLIGYPGASHGAQFQYLARFLANATRSLDA